LQQARDRLTAEKALMSSMSGGSAAGSASGTMTNPLASRRAGAAARKMRTGAKAKFKQLRMRKAKE